MGFRPSHSSLSLCPSTVSFVANKLREQEGFEIPNSDGDGGVQDDLETF